MKVGINLLLWTSVWGRADLPDRSVQQTLGTKGYRGVEVPFCGGPSTRYPACGRMVAAQKLAVALVDSWPDAVPMSDDPTHRASARDHLNGLVDCAEALEAEVAAGGFHHPRGLPFAPETWLSPAISGPGPCHNNPNLLWMRSERSVRP